MIKNENENWSEFQEITEIMEKTRKRQPGEDLTARVMASLPAGEANFRKPSYFPTLVTKMNLGFQESVTRTECAFYFLLTGFFYFILGLILMIGLPFPAISHNNGWLSVQPLFGLLLAAELTIIGLAIYKKGDSAMRFVRAGTLLYVVLIILNCWIGTLYIQPVSAVLLMVIFSMTGLIFAILLGLAIDHYHPQTIYSEVRG